MKPRRPARRRPREQSAMLRAAARLHEPIDLYNPAGRLVVVSLTGRTLVERRSILRP